MHCDLSTSEHPILLRPRARAVTLAALLVAASFAVGYAFGTDLDGPDDPVVQRPAGEDWHGNVMRSGWPER